MSHTEKTDRFELARMKTIALLAVATPPRICKLACVRLRPKIARACAIGALLALAGCIAWAQEVTGSINGQVKDPTGASIPGADVTALHIETGTTRKLLSGEDGSYVFTALPIGTYQIAATLPGFKKTVKSGVELHIGDHLSVDITLQVGELAQEVAVVASAAQVQTESSEQSGLISGDQVRELQLNGRSFMTLLELLPGVASDMPDRADGLGASTRDRDCGS